MVMKNWLFLFLLLCATSCVDEEPVGNRKGDTVAAKLEFWLPALSTATQTKAMTEKDEYTMQDLSLLIFDANGNFVERKEVTITDGAGTAQQSASITLEKADEVQSLVALANVKDLADFPWPSNGEEKDVYLKKLEYVSESAWPTSEDGKRYFPMWGEYKGTLQQDNININMLRALARVNVTVAEGVNFVLKEFTVHNSLKAGYVAPVNNTKFTDKGNVTVPSVPESVSKGDLSYTIPEENENSFVREIYIPEATTSADDGGVYFTLSGEMGGVAKLYRLYLTRNGKKDGEVLQVLRNHTYNINIESIGGNNDLNVTIEAMDECVMRSPYEQNTLTVSENLFYFNPTISDPAELYITTTWDEWKIVDKNLDGFSITEDYKNNKVTITPSGFNKFASGSFYVQSGQLKKKIVIKSDPGETANCYVRGESAQYDLIVSVKGNGRDGMTADGVQLVTEDELKLSPTKIGIIWETSEGLVTLVDNTKQGDDQYVKVIDVDPDNFSGVVKYKVDITKSPGSKGGNALIGAFKDNVCIWSWHIWVVPDFVSRIGTEDWSGNSKSYTFIDRYIGALSNKPGDDALGLLFQWGRKDPFIGANGPQNQTRRTTYNYQPCGSGKRTYTWGVREVKSTTTSVEESINNPTDLLKTGLCNIAKNGTYLWGTPSGMEMYSNSAVNEGNKTIYDPCPAGYRVPPLLAYLFNNDDNYKNNYSGNNLYIPTGDGFNSNAAYYGFWINYKNNSRPSLKDNSTSGTNCTWFPIAGVYNPGTWKVGENVTYDYSKVDKQNSLKVNSIVWTNTPIKYGKDGDAFRPGAMFLHGTENTNDGGSSINGRHLHKFIETSYDLYAQTQFAGSVRCVKIQESQDFSKLNEFPETVTLGASDGSEKTVTIKVINETWEVTNPGAPWFYLDKYSGNPDGGGGQNIVFTASEANTGAQRDAILKIKTSKGSSYDIKVIQRKAINFSVSRRSITLEAKDQGWGNVSQTLTVTNPDNLSWTASSSSGAWLSVTKSYYNKYEFVITATRNNNYIRSGTVTIKPDGGDPIVIEVTQKGSK